MSNSNKIQLDKDFTVDPDNPTMTKTLVKVQQTETQPGGSERGITPDQILKLDQSNLDSVREGETAGFVPEFAITLSNFAEEEKQSPSEGLDVLKEEQLLLKAD